MSRPPDWSPLAGGDPVPGDPDRVEQLGRHYRRVAAAISDAAMKLRQIADHADMQSHAVDAFRDTAREVADDISRARERYDGVGQALTGYAPELRDAQSESAAALVQAKDAEVALNTANRLAGAAETRVVAAREDADTTADRGDHRRALAAADAAGDALAAARGRLSRATDARDAAAHRATGLVEHVKDSGDLNDGWWDNWGAKVVKEIVTWADRVAVVAGVLALAVAWIPVIGQALAAILGTIALVAALVSLLGNVALAATGQGGWSEVAWSALGVVSFGVGRAAITGFRISAQGVRGASRLAAGRLAATSPATRAAAGLPASSSSMAAMRSMLGTANPMSRNAARTAAQRSLEQGFIPSATNIGRNLRAIPGEFADDLRTLRNADWGDALRQAPGHFADQVRAVRAGEGTPVGMRVLGEPGAADQLGRIGAIDDAVRAGGEVAPHVARMNTHTGGFLGAGTYATFDVLRQGDQQLNPPASPADGLQLPAAAGARP